MNNATDARALARSCPTVWGIIEIMPEASGDIDLDGVTKITGGIILIDSYDNGNPPFP